MKKELLPDNVFLTTYSNGMQLYSFHSINPVFPTSPLSCSVPVNAQGVVADGCACIDYTSFGSAPLPGVSSTIIGFFFGLNKFYAFNASTQLHDYRLYVKVILNSSPDQEPQFDNVWYEGYLPWEEPQSANCNINHPMFITWGTANDYNWCDTPGKIVVKKVFRQPSLTSLWTVAAETQGEFFYTYTPTWASQYRPCN